ncbi:hypothetical protein M2251_003739 [Rhodococcus erythropolis]|nr:hypothetical protein [Rhodococcus erythropolis]
MVEVDRQPVPAPIAPLQSSTSTPAVAAAARPTARTPLDLAKVPHVPSDPRPKSVLAYSVSTWSSDHSPPGYWGDNDEQGQLIDDVVSRVLAAFHESATGDDQLELRRARPSIPPDIDRALLLDACEVIQKCDLDERIRYRLRARFWMKYDEPSAVMGI